MLLLSARSLQFLRRLKSLQLTFLVSGGHLLIPTAGTLYFRPFPGAVPRPLGGEWRQGPCVCPQSGAQHRQALPLPGAEQTQYPSLPTGLMRRLSWRMFSGEYEALEEVGSAGAFLLIHLNSPQALTAHIPTLKRRVQL